ncbi:C2H2 conidiation transcriptional factor [Favolaschia claudopus]|uniref:C2H2 conidiation transcriptional factor n=1 Tax=Favolaschia claudopus TaxID=2862362 RepID=A0AAW0EJJ6_9AGAR
MSLRYPFSAPPAPAFENAGLVDTDYAALYHNSASSSFAVGSSAADHLKHLHGPVRYVHARGAQLSAESTVPAPRYSSNGPPNYATGVASSGWGPSATFSVPPVAHSWGRNALASIEDMRTPAIPPRPVHGHGLPPPQQTASEASVPLPPLRYSGPAAPPSLSVASPVSPSSASSSSGSGSGVYKSADGLILPAPLPPTGRGQQMAILLNDGSATQQGDQDHDLHLGAQPGAFTNLRMPVAYAMLYPDLMRQTVEDDTFEEGFMSREKKHGCTMCHKRFDRPSTLKKHLLVHTGEKAFQCTICERRFGVMSNLNRHIRRCQLRRVHTHGSAASAPPSENTTTGGTRGRTLPLSAVAKLAEAGSAPSPVRKRRRRPPSPSRWVPASLLPFNILTPEATPAAPVPLYPVSPSVHNGPDVVGGECGPQWDEERDSWDENFGSAPYHSREWVKKGKLPGPLPMPCGVKFGGGIAGNYSGNLDFGYSRAVRV